MGIEPDIEVLELAISREVDAYKLYMGMAQRVDDPLMKEVLESFAKEELEHKARLELELMKLGIVVRPSAACQESDDESAEPDLGMDYKDALLFAMRKERASLRLYVDLAAVAKDKATREMLVMLAEEEAMHQARFEVEYNALIRKHK